MRILLPSYPPHPASSFSKISHVPLISPELLPLAHSRVLLSPSLFLSTGILQQEGTRPLGRFVQVQQNSGVASMPVTTATALATAVSAAAATGNTGSGGGGGSGNGHASGKRYTCLYCPYGTDRRDLYTRHENIHREEKPFHCYVCYKPFSRADHVKKHFLRMHRYVVSFACFIFLYSPLPPSCSFAPLLCQRRWVGWMRAAIVLLRLRSRAIVAMSCIDIYGG